MAPPKKAVAAPAKTLKGKKEVKKTVAKVAGASTGDLEALVAGNYEMTKKDAKETVKFFVESLISLVEENGCLRIADFGIFSVKTIAARNGRNPKTGETMKLSATKSISFRPSKSLKDRIRS